MSDTNNKKKSKHPLVRSTQELQEAQLEAFEYLGNALQEQDKRISTLEKKVAKLEEKE